MLAEAAFPRRGAASSRHRKSLQHELQGLSPPPKLYRDFFTPTECKMLDCIPAESALSELCLLRILLVRVLAAAKRSGERASGERRPSWRQGAPGKAGLSLTKRLAMLMAFSHTALTMASLVRFENKYAGPATWEESLINVVDDLDPFDLRAFEEPPK
ncbi:MAG: hypothetical protein V1755_00775 [Chloroflexota bacterium]